MLGTDSIVRAKDAQRSTREVAGFETSRAHEARWRCRLSGSTIHYRRGKRMAIVLIHEGPTVTQENYDRTVEKLTGGKTKMESLSDWPVDGILVHIAGEGPNGFRVVDVWESQEAVDAFGEKLGPILAEVGITDP